jgi:hypothetical protein
MEHKKNVKPCFMRKTSQNPGLLSFFPSKPHKKHMTKRCEKKPFSCGYALDSLDLSRKVMGLLPKNGGGVSVSAQEVCLHGIRSKH